MSYRTVSAAQGYGISAEEADDPSVLEFQAQVAEAEAEATEAGAYTPTSVQHGVPAPEPEIGPIYEPQAPKPSAAAPPPAPSPTPGFNWASLLDSKNLPWLIGGGAVAIGLLVLAGKRR